jgi:hypothetical protein
MASSGVRQRQRLTARRLADGGEFGGRKLEERRVRSVAEESGEKDRREGAAMLIEGRRRVIRRPDAREGDAGGSRRR